MKKNTITLTVGDWSDDGHGKTDTFLIKTKHNTKELNDAFKEGTRKIGFDLLKECDEYEKNELSEKAESCLKKAGYYGNNAPEEGGAYPEEYIEIYLFICKLGDPDFKYKLIKPEEGNYVNIGGYGLYD